MTYESIIIPVLTFLLGVLSGLLYKYADIIKLKVHVEDIKVEVIKLQDNQVSILSLASDVRVMKDSIIFQPSFQRELQLLCAERQAKGTL